MTDDEIREALKLDFEQTADWRHTDSANHLRKFDRPVTFGR